MERARSEQKTQDLLQVKNSWRKPVSKTKRAYVDAATIGRPSLLAPNAPDSREAAASTSTAPGAAAANSAAVGAATAPTKPATEC